MPWDIVTSTPIAGTQRENDYFAGLDVSAKTAYVAYAMQRLKNAGLSCGGATMCWSIAASQDADFGRATLEAMRSVYGPKDVMIFNDSLADPAVVYRSTDGYAAVKTPPSVSDIDGVLYRQGSPTAEEIEAAATAMISADGQSGTFVNTIKSGKPLILITHIQSLYTNGLESGMEVYQLAIDRLNRYYGNEIQWMTTEQIADQIAHPAPEPSTAALVAIVGLSGLLIWGHRRSRASLGCATEVGNQVGFRS
jgi:hypothetical protein